MRKPREKSACEARSWRLSRVNATGMLVAGHRVAVKGLYIEGVPARINLTSVVDLGAGCPEGASKEQA